MKAGETWINKCHDGRDVIITKVDTYIHYLEPMCCDDDGKWSNLVPVSCDPETFYKIYEESRGEDKQLSFFD